MKININSLKAHKLFPKDTNYRISPPNEVELENSNLLDEINDIDIQSVSEIINVRKKLEKVINVDIFKSMTIQVNVNDYYDNTNNDNIKHDLSAVSIYAYPIDRLLIFGTKYRDNHIASREITEHFNMKEGIQFTVCHEIAHMLEYVQLENRAETKDNNLSDKILNVLRNKKLREIPYYHTTENKLETVLITLSSEMYADTMSILLNSKDETKEYTMSLLDKVIEHREKESLVTITSFSSNGLPPSLGITSDHFTVTALQKLKQEMEKSYEFNSIEEMNQLVEKCVSFGLIKNMLFMSKIEKLQPMLTTFFHELIGYEMNAKDIESLLEKEVDTNTLNQMKNALCNEDLNKYSGSTLNKNRFKSVFHPIVWEKENAPLKILSIEERKRMVEFLRHNSMKNTEKKLDLK